MKILQILHIFCRDIPHIWHLPGCLTETRSFDDNQIKGAWDTGENRVEQSQTTNRRQGQDRRQHPTPPISRYTFRGRRRQARRAEEARNYYVDRFGAPYLLVILAVIILCGLDAFLTLHLLQRGGFELNPIMARLIERDPGLFLAVKFTITIAGIFFLLIHKNFHVAGRFPVARIIYAIFLGYLILVLYEVYLYLQRVPAH